jgi:hypothetical protein
MTTMLTLWPRPMELAAWPSLPRGPLSASAQVQAYATALLQRQSEDYDALDTKAVTVIAAVLVFAGLVFPNLRPPDSSLHRALVLLLLAFSAYTFSTALGAYRVATLKMPWTPKAALGAINRTATAAQAAQAHAALKAYVTNWPVVERKAQFVKLSVYSLAPLGITVAALFATNGFK